MNDHERHIENIQKITRSLSYRLAYQDVDFLMEPELRAARMELELLKPELYLHKKNIHSTIVAFGSARIPEPVLSQEILERAETRLAETPNDPRRRREVERHREMVNLSRYYDVAREFGKLVSQESLRGGGCDYVVVTGGGPGIMEAANRGAYDVGAPSVGFNIALPHEQQPNPYITPELCFQFRYFAVRKFHFLLRAKALAAFPGGFGTLDELFDALTLRQTGRMQVIPIILFGRAFWERTIDFQFLADSGVIDDNDLDLIHFVEEPAEAWKIISQFHHLRAEQEAASLRSDGWDAD